MYKSALFPLINETFFYVSFPIYIGIIVGIVCEYLIEHKLNQLKIKLKVPLIVHLERMFQKTPFNMVKFHLSALLHCTQQQCTVSIFVFLDLAVCCKSQWIFCHRNWYKDKKIQSLTERFNDINCYKTYPDVWFRLNLIHEWKLMILNLQNNIKIPTLNINPDSLAICYARVLQYSL